eukprot:gene9526-biopygen6205
MPRRRAQPEGTTGKRVTANRLRMGRKGSRDSRWEARLLPEPIRIIGPHFARAGCASHRGANLREACQISVPRRNS